MKSKNGMTWKEIKWSNVWLNGRKNEWMIEIDERNEMTCNDMQWNQSNEGV